MKKFLFALCLTAMLPMTVLAVNVLRRTPYDGSPGVYFTSFTAGDKVMAIIHPTTTQFTVDSAQAMFYRFTGAGATVTFRIKFYSPSSSTVNGDCGCTTGPGTLLGDYGPFTASGTAQLYPNFRKVDLVPNLVINGDFLMSVEYVSTSSGSYSSVLFDGSENMPACCDQYGGDATGVWDNQAFATDLGWLYEGVYGEETGTVVPGILTISSLSTMGGAAVDSTVDDTLVLGNSGGSSLTISNIASDNADFWTTPTSGITIAAGATYKLAVHFQPSAAGDESATLTFTDGTPTSPHTKVLTGRGESSTLLMLFENWWNGNGDTTGWSIEEFGEADTTGANWGLYYTGGHTDAYANVWAEHDYSPASDTLLDILGSHTLNAPAGGTVSLNFRERLEYYPDYYWGHYLALGDSDTTWSILNELTPADNGTWYDYPVTYYVTGLDSEYSQFHLGFVYYGADADNWLLDDIEIRDVPQVPPFLSADPRGDAFVTDHEIVAYCWDSNSDAFTVNAHISSNGGPTTSYTMVETPSGSANFCLPFSTFLSGAGTYDYYLTATDDDGTTRWPDAGTYNFEVATQVGATELVYHDGTWNNAHYYLNMAAEEAVRFTPPSYPFQVTGAKIGILNAFPNSAHEQIVVKIYADDGAGGLPGTLLYQQQTGSIGNECDGLNDTTYQTYMAEAVIRQNIVINSGTFYVAIKNPADAVSGIAEAWTLDTLGSGNSYFFDPSTSTWSAIPDSLGDVMISALGFAVPTAPILTVYNSIDNLSANIFVNSVVGTIPRTNIFVSTPYSGAPTLLAGSPFTTSPIVYPFPVATGVTIFSATTVAGPIDRSSGVPAVESAYPRYSVVTPADMNTPVRAVRDAVRVDVSKPLPAPLDFNRPTVIAVDKRTGETKMTSISRPLGKAEAVGLSSAPKAVRGPVRSKALMNHANPFRAASVMN
jgi:hypothetical protein